MSKKPNEKLGKKPSEKLGKKLFDHRAEFARFYGAPEPVAQTHFGFFVTDFCAANSAQIAARIAQICPAAEHFANGYFFAPLAQKERLTRAGISGVYVLDAASFACAQMLAQLVREGDSVCDFCAAPGGKSIVAASLLRARGVAAKWACNEANRTRFFALKAALAQHQIPARCFNHDARAIGKKCPERFDVVLLDAPCSSNAHDFGCCKTAAEVKKIARTQRQLIASALAALRPGGWLLYATCSYNEAENEAAIGEFLASGEASPVSATPVAVCESAKNQSLDFSAPCLTLSEASDLSPVSATPVEIFCPLEHFASGGGIRIVPTFCHRGLFIAVLRKALR